ncbi:class I SAM-dependent methyltransferase [Streptacidiphilus jiangxiensis]|uniref:Methyltransferase domain-containing protein n=1 Tax=Streptacidiphilus jiangxiensis TaxID=235985 RepID=A0A1H7VYM7_STRJI|nr:class I SAM-dependent methyltransferase [Streptacidiphilus jiangxiensis]SEM14356.1 Methyltransferase domain-containing protein [Streptacidiphilus jiangxiensis]
MAHGAHQHGHGDHAKGHGHGDGHHVKGHGKSHEKGHGKGHGHGPHHSGHPDDADLRFSEPRPGDRGRIEAVWPFVREQLPAAPGSVLEIGCGVLGGFVPLLRDEGYHAVGVDPEVPEAPDFVRSRYEDYRPDAEDLPFDAVVGCLSFHHVEDLDLLLARAASQLRPGGLLILREWAREEFDEVTARWCFERLPEEQDEQSPAWWLAGHREGWREAGGSWEAYFQGWAEGHGLLSGAAMLRALEASPFETVSLERDPYFHTALAGVTEAEERAGVDAGLLRANGMRYVGRRP